MQIFIIIIIQSCRNLQTSQPLLFFPHNLVLGHAFLFTRSQNKTKANQLMTAIRQFIRTYPYVFEDRWASVLSEGQEAVFGWITANYLKGTIGSTNVRALNVSFFFFFKQNTLSKQLLEVI